MLLGGNRAPISSRTRACVSPPDKTGPALTGAASLSLPLPLEPYVRIVVEDEFDDTCVDEDSPSVCDRDPVDEGSESDEGEAVEEEDAGDEPRRSAGETPAVWGLVPPPAPARVEDTMPRRMLCADNSWEAMCSNGLVERSVRVRSMQNTLTVFSAWYRLMKRACRLSAFRCIEASRPRSSATSAPRESTCWVVRERAERQQEQVRLGRGTPVSEAHPLPRTAAASLASRSALCSALPCSRYTASARTRSRLWASTRAWSARHRDVDADTCVDGQAPERVLIV